MEIIELVAIIGTVSGSIVGVMKYEIKRLCKDIDGIAENHKELKKDVKEMHEEIFHKHGN